MQKLLPGFTLLIGVGLILLLACYGTLSSLKPQPTMKELCIDLQVALEHPLCGRSDSLHELIAISFTLGKTSRTEVNALIGKYRYEVNIWPRGKIQETYIFNRTLLNRIGLSPTYLYLEYDRNDTLIYISYQD